MNAAMSIEKQDGGGKENGFELRMDADAYIAKLTTKAIRNYSSLKGLTREMSETQFAYEAGLSPSTVNGWLNPNKNTTPSVPVFGVLCKLAGVTSDDAMMYIAEATSSQTLKLLAQLPVEESKQELFYGTQQLLEKVGELDDIRISELILKLTEELHRRNLQKQEGDVK